jgi:putative transposase
MCKVLRVSRSGFYAWLTREPSKRSIENKSLIKQIKIIHMQSQKTYGSPRITDELNRQNYNVSRPRIARLMRKEKICSIVRKKYTVTTDSKHNYPVSSNLLQRNFTAYTPGIKWVSDITYIKVKSNWLYLTTVIDLFDRKVIGWALSSTMSAKDTTIPALKMALNNRRKQNHIIFHSDRGIQYAAQDFRELLKKHQIKQSMSRKGNCWDNAVAESFFKTIKSECINHFKFESLFHAKLEIFKYIETWYNRKRRHSFLGYATPLEMEILFFNKKVA